MQLQTGPRQKTKRARKAKQIMNQARPVTTLFMLMSLDGKISTGDVNERDVDTDFPLINGVSEGLNQYYSLEQETDLFSLNTGKTQAKIGVNTKKDVSKTPVSFIIIDNKPYLTDVGVNYFVKKSKTFFLVTTNKNHPAFQATTSNNLEILYYKNEIDFEDVFHKFKTTYNINAFTIQSGGTLNSVLLRKGLIDQVSIVIAPCLIGGHNTSTLIDGKSLSTVDELSLVKPLVFKSCKALKNSYIHLKYDVQNE